MTDTTRIRTYAAFFGILVILFVLGAVFGPRRARQYGPVYPDIDAGEVFAVDLSSAAAAISLRREGEGWVLDEGVRTFPARAERVDSFVAEAAGSTLVRRITGNESLWPDFGLGPVGATEVTLHVTDRSGARSVTAVWGAAATEPGRSYVRLPQTPEVFSTDGELGFYLGQPSTYWSYLRVLPETVTASDMIRVSSEFTGEIGGEPHSVSYRITRSANAAADSGGQQEVWTSEVTEAALDGDSVLRTLREIANGVGSDFAREAAQQGAEDGGGTIRMELADGRSYSLEVVKTSAGFVCRAGGPAVPGDEFGGLSYTLSDSTVKRLFPAIDTLTAD